jgi:peptide chain release factor subunit 1
MPKTTTALHTPLREQLDRLAAFEPTNWPVLSLYLDRRPDQQGRRDHCDAFLRKVLPERSRSLQADARRSFDRDADRIREYLNAQVPASVTSLALFACAGANKFFEAVQLDVPIEQHWLFIGSVPHLYPLVKLNDQYPRYAALLVDTNSARLFVFSLGRVESRERITNVKTRKGAVGGWTQARYQRHLDNFHLHHMKEVAAILDQVVREEAIDHVLIACDEVARPLLMEQLPKHLHAKVVDTLHLDINAPEHQVLAETLDVLRQHDGDDDAVRVQAMLDQWAAGGLAVVGPDATLDALARKQVEELLITATPGLLRAASTIPPGTAPGPVDVDTSAGGREPNADLIKLAGDLVTRAGQNSARIRFIEKPDLLAGVGGVGALLRFRI